MVRAALISHRSISANHPSANGQAERAVQYVKRALEEPHLVSVPTSYFMHGTQAILPSPSATGSVVPPVQWSLDS